MRSLRDGLLFVLTLPERVFRAVAAGLGGTVHETATLVLPRFVRRSRFYEASAKNLLRISIELVGGVEDSPTHEPTEEAGKLAIRKGAGNIVELGSIAAFGFSPLWLLAAASDVLSGSRVYLKALVLELEAAGVLAEEADISSVDDLLGALERTSGRTAQLIDIPPVELQELRTSLAEFRSDAEALPDPRELAVLFDGLRRTAAAENRSLLEVSSGIGLAFLTSARKVSRDELVVPYREDWRPLAEEGFATYAGRVSTPYRDAVLGHFDRRRPTWTGRVPGLLRRQFSRLWRRLRSE